MKVDLLGKQFTVGYVTDLKEAKEILSEIDEDRLFIDIETTPSADFKDHVGAAFNPRTSRIASVQLFLPSEEEELALIFHVDLMKGWQKVFKPFLEENNLIAHNASFEWKHLHHNGIDVSGLGDTMLLYQTYNCAVKEFGASKPASLYAFVKDLIGFEMNKVEGAGNWDVKEMSLSQKEYAALDVIAPWYAAKQLARRIEKRGKEAVWDSYDYNKKILPSVARMEYNGIHFNKKLHDKFVTKIEAEDDKRRAAVEELITEGVNIRSGKQMDKLIREIAPKKTIRKWPKSPKTGLLVMDKKTLPLFTDIPLIQRMVDYREYSHVVSHYGHSLRSSICPVTKRLIGNFTLCKTQTGRMSSFKPNFQNFPRGEFKDIFDSPRGRKLICCDLSQIEVRVAAHVSQDEALLDIFASGRDVYRETAALLLDCDPGDVTKEQRDLAKPVLLGRIYGRGKHTTQKSAWTDYGIKITVDEAEELLLKIDDFFPGVVAWKDQESNFAELHKYCVTTGGKKCKLPRENYFCKALNYKIQGSAGEIIKEALFICNYKINKAKLDIITSNCVHDEILLESPTKLANKAVKILQESMETAMMKFFPDACLEGLAEAKIGNNWNEVK